MKKLCVRLSLVLLLLISPIHALVGASFHWGFDFSLDMDDISFKPILFSSIVAPDELLSSISSIESLLPDEIGANKIQSFKDTINNHIEVLNQNSPISFKRRDWRRSKINFGGKIFFDAIPIIDAVDLSFNIGAWEYTSVVRFPNGTLKKSTIDMKDITNFLSNGEYENFIGMDSIEITLKTFGYNYLEAFNLSKTPFVKLHFDLTVRKNLFALPNTMKIFRLYLGLGPSLHFSTPLLTNDFILETLKEQVAAAMNNIEQINEYLSNETIMKIIMDKLIDEAKNPTFGMHFIAGTMVKIPVIPLGIYFDSKFMIPFGKLDEVVELGGLGFHLNLGVCLAL